MAFNRHDNKNIILITTGISAGLIVAAALKSCDGSPFSTEGVIPEVTGCSDQEVIDLGSAACETVIIAPAPE